MAIRIAGASNPVNQLEFEVELDDGDTLTFTVPKAQYLPESVMAEYEPWLEDWQKRVRSTSKAGAAERAKMRTYDPMLRLLELLLPEGVHAKLSTCTRGVLMDIDRQWLKESDTTVGESGASVAS